MSEEAKSKSDELEGKLIGGRYEVVKLLGKGGMGKVFKVRHVELEKVFAMKTLHTHLTHDETTVERFKREAKAASRVGCENIIEMTDSGYDEAAGHFFVMEFLQGDDLSKRIKKYGPMHYSLTAHVILQVCDALLAVHQEGIIHRDLKPENIVLIDKDRRVDVVKILDFGIAAMKSQFEEGAERLTQAGTIFGTPTYMSPEQAYGMDLDHRTDIYSLGCIMYEMVTGFVPFKADHPLQVLDMHLNVLPTPPSQVRPDLNIPAPLEAIILRAMAKNRDERYQSVFEIQQAILGFYQPGITPITRQTGDGTVTTGDASLLAAQTLAQPRMAGGGAPMGTQAVEVAGPGISKALIAVIVAVLVLAIGGVVAAVVVKNQRQARVAAEQAEIQRQQQEEERKARAAEARRLAEEREAERLRQEERDRRLLEQVAAQAAAAAPQEETITVTFQSDPPGASVLLNGVVLGVTQFKKTFTKSDGPPAKFELRLQGHEVKTVDVSMSESTTVAVALPKVAEAKSEPKPAGERTGGGTRPPRERRTGGGTPGGATLRVSDDFQ